jgi:hypothetical protein
MRSEEMPTEGLKEILLLIASLLLNPFLPSFGLQTAISIAIGMMLPQRFVEPINLILYKIPLINKALIRFEKKLKQRKRLKTTIPRILAGYFITSLVGGILLITAFIL